MAASRAAAGDTNWAGVTFRLSRFSQAYRQRLIDGIGDLHRFCVLKFGIGLTKVTLRAKTADRVVAEYVMCRFGEKKGTKLSLVKHALLGVQHTFPHLRGHLNVSWANLKTWEEQRLAKLRPPLPVPLWLLAIGLARAHSKIDNSRTQSERWLIFSILLEIGLLCMLRPGELQKLTHADVAMPGTFVMSKAHAALKITSPKNRRQFGEFQFVLLRRPNAISWLAKIHQEGSDKPIWNGSSREFSDKFRQMMKELGLSGLGFTPGSLRAGGATMFFNRNTPISSLRFMGRWAAEKSLEHYIQLAMSTQIMNRLTPSVITRLQKLSPLCLSHVRSCSLHVGQVIEPPPAKGASPRDIVHWCDRYTELA